MSIFTPVYRITPIDTTVTNNYYTINNRVDNLTGIYVDNSDNYYTDVTIVDETNNRYYDMTTKTYYDIKSWSYDYSSRTYFLTLDNDVALTVQFGDTNVTITNNNISNTYNYVVEDDTGSDPDTPTTCKHDWQETIDTAPTCLEGGHASYTCSLCGETYEQNLAAKGHDWKVIEHVNMVYNSDGTVATQGHTLYQCSVCGEQWYTDTGAPPPDISVDTIVNVKKQNGQWTVSTTTLYRYIDRGYIPGVTNKHLPEKPRRKQRKTKTVKAANAPKGLPIDRRPEAIANRNAFGHWEFDSVIGKAKGRRQSILTLTERKTRFEIIIRADAKTSAETVKALNKTIKKFPQGTFKTITVDNGSEFQDCYGMEHDHLGTKRLTVYYAHPYSSWERGSNERNNRIIRRYFPKKTSFAKITQTQCDRVADAINSMPRKILNWKSAKDLFEQEIANLQNLSEKIF